MQCFEITFGHHALSNWKRFVLKKVWNSTKMFENFIKGFTKTFFKKHNSMIYKGDINLTNSVSDHLSQLTFLENFPVWNWDSEISSRDIQIEDWCPAGGQSYHMEKMCFTSLYQVTLQVILSLLIILETQKYWVSVRQGQSYLTGGRCLCSSGWSPF